MDAPSPPIPAAPATPAASPLSLDAPLPAGIAGRSQGWLTRYRRYPAFSPPWSRGRLRALGPLALLVLLAAAAPLALAPPERVPFDGMLQVAMPPVVHLMNTPSTAALSFFLGGGAGLFAWRRERAGLAALARAQAARREAELRLSVLAAQVEPHFLFNTLAGVRSAITTSSMAPSRRSGPCASRCTPRGSTTAGSG
jgi:hypothetical protein